MADHGWFVLHDSKDGQFYFNLEAENDQVLMTSETYTTKQKAEQGMNAVRRVVPGAVSIDFTASGRASRA